MSIRRLAGRALALCGALVLASCAESVTGPSDLQGGAWRLASMETETGGRFVPDDPGRFTVEFDADGTVGVRADCNGCGGSYTLDGDGSPSDRSPAPSSRARPDAARSSRHCSTGPLRWSGKDASSRSSPRTGSSC